MSRIILPIDINPIFISRYETSVCFSVIQAQKIDIEPLVATQMMNFHHSLNFVWEFDTIKDMTWYSDIKLFKKYLYWVDHPIPTWSKSDIKGTLFSSLKLGRYVHLKADTFYLGNDESADSFHRVVECLVYGYDDDQQVFHYLRFFPDHGVTECFATYENMVDAICNREDGKILLIALEFNKVFQSKLDIKKLYNGSIDFLNSTNQENALIHNEPIEQGVSSFRKLREYLSQVGLYYEYIDRKYYTAFVDFQTALYFRYSYLRKTEIIESNQFDETLELLKEAASTFLNNCTNYNHGRNLNLMKEILRDFDWLVDTDILITRKIIENLKEVIASEGV